MRAAGIPSRIVTGYLGGEINPVGNYMIVRQADAHAWTEVQTGPLRWTTIDPTPPATLRDLHDVETTLADRLIALDLLLVALMTGIVVDAAHRDSTTWLNLLVVIAIIGFTATVAVSRFMEQRR